MAENRSTKTKTKRGWRFYVGIFCAIGAIVMVFHNIIASLVYGIAAFFFLLTSHYIVATPDHLKASDNIDQLKASPSSLKKSTPIKPSKDKYVINPQTMVIHKPSCRYAKNAYSFNTHYTNNLHAALDMGYRRCKYCKPQ